jgi:hypothetical protein
MGVMKMKQNEKHKFWCLVAVYAFNDIPQGTVLSYHYSHPLATKALRKYPTGFVGIKENPHYEKFFYESKNCTVEFID